MQKVKPGLNADGTKLIATDQSHVDQLAEAMVKFASPVANGPAEQPEVPVPADTLHEAYEFKGFEIAPGDYRVLMILRPQLGEDGKPTPPPQIQFGCVEADWKGYVKQALKQGINNGTILSADNRVLSGFTVVADTPGSDTKQKIAFLFSQVVSFLPYKEVEAGLDQKHANAKQVWRRTLDERRRKKMLARQRRRNV